MDLFSTLTAALQAAAPAAPVARVTLTLPTPLPPALQQALQSAGATAEVPLTVVGPAPGQSTGQSPATPPGTVVLRLPDGTEFTARLSSPSVVTLPPGTRFTLPATAQLSPASGTPATPASPLTIPIRLNPPPSGSLSAAPLPSGASSPPLVASSPPRLATVQLLPAGPVNSTPTLPPGPVGLTLPAGVTAPTTPVQATVSSPPSASGGQQVLLSAPENPATKPLQATLTTGLALPVGTRLPLQALPGRPAALLLAPVPLPAQSAAASPVPPLPLLRIIGTNPLLTATSAPLTARALPLIATPGAPMLRQPLLLPDGTLVHLDSPAGLPAGSLVTLQPGPTPTVLGVQTPVPPATTPALTAISSNQPTAGTALQGVIIPPPEAAPGQPAITLPLLSVTTPGPWQGALLPLQVPATTALPPGTLVSLHLLPGGQAQLHEVILPAAFTRAQALPQLATAWPALQNLSQALPGLLPAAARQLTARLPTLAAFLPGFLSYTSAIQANRPADLFGPDTLALAQSLGLDLATDVRHLHALQQPVNTAPGQPDETWRGLLFPYQDAPQSPYQQGRFFWRRQQPEQDPQASADTRFVIELSLSQVGAIQLDGLLSYPSLWLRLRTRQPGAAELLTGLPAVVQSTLAGYGLAGALSLEHTTQFPIDPVAELLAAASSSTSRHY